MTGLKGRFTNRGSTEIIVQVKRFKNPPVIRRFVSYDLAVRTLQMMMPLACFCCSLMRAEKMRVLFVFFFFFF